MMNSLMRIVAVSGAQSRIAVVALQLYVLFLSRDRTGKVPEPFLITLRPRATIERGPADCDCAA
jgi:hypothetical protein